jgi:thiamine biosynthesis lipoprotein
MIIVASRWVYGQGAMDVEEILKSSAETHKPLLVVFAGSDWCAPCIQFEKNILSESSFQEFADKNLLLYKADFPQRKALPPQEQEQNDWLAERYNPEGLFPHIVLLKPDHTVLAVLKYNRQSPAAFIETIRTYLVQ